MVLSKRKYQEASLVKKKRIQKNAQATLRTLQRKHHGIINPLLKDTERSGRDAVDNFGLLAEASSGSQLSGRRHFGIECHGSQPLLDSGNGVRVERRLDLLRRVTRAFLTAFVLARATRSLMLPEHGRARVTFPFDSLPDSSVLALNEWKRLLDVSGVTIEILVRFRSVQSQRLFKST